ncbi:MAG: hypothetical protein WC058_09755, partial [Phycisphaeraceae bacterium]
GAFQFAPMARIDRGQRVADGLLELLMPLKQLNQLLDANGITEARAHRVPGDGEVVSHERLGGLFKHFYRKTAG